MKKSIQFWFASGIALCTLATTSPSFAQIEIVPDTTLPVNSKVTLDGNTSIITDGTTAGDNLFHSFERFSVPTGSTAYFNNALNIQNIISRVTGGSVSNIDGLLQANGTANLFLLNPNGIIFGSNASLNIGGSFLASTASAVNFADGTQFSATVYPTTPLLTVSVPLGLQYGGTTSEGIRVQGSRLEMESGKTLALIGSDVSLDDGTLFAPGGQVELGGLAGAGTVGLNVDGNNLGLSFPVGVQRADVSLANGAQVNVLAGGGGSIAINAQNLNLEGGSELQAGIASKSGSVDSVAGDIEINATEAINLTSDSSISNSLSEEAVGNGGSIRISTGSLALRDGARMTASTNGQGDAGSVTINARDTVSFNGVGSNGFPSGIFSTVRSSAVGKSGDINITTGSLAVTDGAVLSADTRGQGNAGSVTIDARDTVSFSGISSNEFSGGAFSSVLDEAVGNGGDIKISTGSLALRDGTQLTASTRGWGNAGSVTIIARDTVSFDGTNRNGESTGAFSSVITNGAVGDGGNINITTGSLAVINGAQLTARTRGQGNAGSVTITARDTVSFNGGSSYGSVNGEVSSVNVSSEGEGLWSAGNLTVKAGDLLLDNQGNLRASTASGEGGDINLQVQNLILMRRNSKITAEADDTTGNGGSVKIVAPLIVAVPSEDSDIVANAIEGEGGDINITTRGIYGLVKRDPLTAESDINASSEFGVDGVVEINTLDIDPSQALVTLPVELVDASGLIVSGCGTGGSQGQSEFIVTGRGGLPPNPSETLSSDTVWTDLRPSAKLAENLTSSESTIQQTNPTTGQLVEAQGWVINSKGKVVLTASAPTVTPHSPGLTTAECNTP